MYRFDRRQPYMNSAIHWRSGGSQYADDGEWLVGMAREIYTGYAMTQRNAVAHAVPQLFRHGGAEYSFKNSVKLPSRHKRERFLVAVAEKLEVVLRRAHNRKAAV